MDCQPGCELEGGSRAEGAVRGRPWRADRPPPGGTRQADRVTRVLQHRDHAAYMIGCPERLNAYVVARLTGHVERGGLEGGLHVPLAEALQDAVDRGDDELSGMAAPYLQRVVGAKAGEMNDSEVKYWFDEVVWKGPSKPGFGYATFDEEAWVVLTVTSCTSPTSSRI